MEYRECVSAFNKYRKYVNDRRRNELKNNGFTVEEIDRIAPRPRKVKATEVITQEELQEMVEQARKDAEEIGSRKSSKVWAKIYVLSLFFIKDGKLSVK